MRTLLRIWAIPLLAMLGSSVFSAEIIFDRLKSTEKETYSIIGTGFVTDDSHPMHAGYFTKLDATLILSINPELGETGIEFQWVDDGKENSEKYKYYIRRGRLFQVDDSGLEKNPEHLADLSAATVAALHPEIVANAMLERRENLEPDRADGFLFAWNDELWSVVIDNKTGRISSLHRRLQHEVHGDGSENIHFDGETSGEGANHPAAVSVSLGGREIARFKFGAAAPKADFVMPKGDKYLDNNRVISEKDIKFTQIAANLFSIDLASINTRVMVAEFIDFLVVLEGAYNSRNCDLLALKIQEHFQKPVKYFAFSHLHGQYIGGARSWVAEGATVIVPPTTVKLIEEMVNTPHDLQPDALTRNPKPLSITTAKEGRRIDDATNALEIYNIESGHTDEYFIFYFPRQKVLMNGDLLFYRPGQPLSDRSQKLCQAVQKLGLDVDSYVCTWPLTGYDTKNIVTKAEMQDACSASK